ncbi:hypothetical protein NDU88_000580 [Pleurodeles waltl]|uniref:Uncharacterized protein n=1 Tax=Pleurodeles waltl TaxID=8319 RepID=A0AAV7V5H2_PLEWA|nr:hypothetical protein NDU88_000580 [Pleurodeles waltl]
MSQRGSEDPVDLFGTVEHPEHHAEAAAADKELLSPEASNSSDLGFEDLPAAQKVLSTESLPLSPRYSPHTEQVTFKGSPKVLRAMIRTPKRHFGGRSGNRHHLQVGRGPWAVGRAGQPVDSGREEAHSAARAETQPVGPLRREAVPDAGWWR